jgi:hypothetical protein
VRRRVSVVSTRSIVSLVVAVAVMAGCVAAGAASPVQTTRSNRARAVDAAEQLLGQVVLPAGASEIPAAPSAAGDLLARPDQAFWIASQVDRHVFWTTTSSPEAAMASIKAHLPQSAKLVGHGYGGSELFATYAVPTIDRTSLGARQLVLEVLGLSDGSTVVRADGEVRYIAPRPYDERIPAQARVLDITVGSNLSRPLLSLTVTKVSDVRRIARVVDDLPFVGNESGVGFSCPSFSASSPVDRFIFRSAPGGAVLARITELAATPTEDYPCFGTSLTIRGHHEPPLQDGGILLKQAGSLLRIRLSR